MKLSKFYLLLPLHSKNITDKKPKENKYNKTLLYELFQESDADTIWLCLVEHRAHQGEICKPFIPLANNDAGINKYASGQDRAAYYCESMQ